MTIKSFSDLKGLMAPRFINEALELAALEQFQSAADKLDTINLSSDHKAQYADALAYTYYRRALLHQSKLSMQRAINDLETARSFPGIKGTLRTLIQDRLTKIQTGAKSEAIKKLDDAITQYFETPHRAIDLRQEFLRRYGLSQPQRARDLSNLDGISTVGVYRWKADSQYGEQFSQRIRNFKAGDESTIAFFGRVLAEHVRTNTQTMEWLTEVDYIIPIPAEAHRSATRGAEIVAEMADHLSQRLAIPHRTDILKRGAGSARARSTRRSELERQYSLASPNKEQHVRGRVVLLLDDVRNHGHTATVCAQRLKDAGCRKVYFLALAQAESTLQSRRHFGDTAGEAALRLGPWLCLAAADGLGPARLKALFKTFPAAEDILTANRRDLGQIPTIGPKVSDAIRNQASRINEFNAMASELLNTAATMDARVLTLHDPQYPLNLAASGAAPAIVYALASTLDVLQEPNTVAIVGTRQPVVAATELVRIITTALAKEGCIVVSGMANGIDSLAHAACLEAGQTTIAFLGNGVDVTYPPSAKTLRQEILRRGALVSEYPFGMRTNENRLRRRNTLTVAHSRAVIVIQSAANGGTMNAARAATRLGKPILCVEPLAGYENEFSGNAELLNSGLAQPISAQNPLASLLAAVK